MGRRTNVEVVIDYLKDCTHHSASIRAIARDLGWTEEKVARVIERAEHEGANLHRSRGGAIKFRGSERGAANGLYRDIMNVVERHWAPKTLKLKNISVFDTSKAGQRSAGVWSHPDLVMAADPPRRDSRTEERRLHAIEVETAHGFDLKSIYQAHAQGRGATYSWVIGQHAPYEGHEHWERVKWTASVLGVGLVTFDKPDVFSTWEMWNEPERVTVTPAERERFLTIAVGNRLRWEYDL